MRQILSKKSALKLIQTESISEWGMLWRFIFFCYIDYFIDFYNYLTLPSSIKLKTNKFFLDDHNVETYFSKALSILVIIIIFYVYKKNNKNFLNFFLGLLLPITIQSYTLAILFLFVIAIPIKVLGTHYGQILGGYSVILFYHFVFLLMFVRCIKNRFPISDI
jgi:hypothetical protein